MSLRNFMTNFSFPIYTAISWLGHQSQSVLTLLPLPTAVRDAGKLNACSLPCLWHRRDPSWVPESHMSTSIIENLSLMNFGWNSCSGNAWLPGWLWAERDPDQPRNYWPLTYPAFPAAKTYHHPLYRQLARKNFKIKHLALFLFVSSSKTANS